jgi:hypothetical protein
VVPPQVIYGILAQESNWNQASRHALAGYEGNPLVANYHGSSAWIKLDRGALAECTSAF